MRTLILKTTMLVGLYLLCFSDSTMAVEKAKDKTNNQSLSERADKNSQNVLASKKVKKLTFREKIKLIKKIKKEQKKARKMGVKSDDKMILLYVLAVLLPPVAVGIFTDWDAKPTLIDLLLTLIFWLPGVVYAFYILLS
ncbi:MAG: YqaE/Pmp3 family membrane protein [Bacteroidales bacterium]|nr:YqaE/Pmp3 family membrane protein [Bacteroidales bacterium]